MHPFYILLKPTEKNIPLIRSFVEKRDHSLELIEFKKGTKYQRRMWCEYLDHIRFPDVFFAGQNEDIDFGFKQPLKGGCIFTDAGHLMVVGQLTEETFTDSGFGYFNQSIQGWCDSGLIYRNGQFHQVIGKNQDWVEEDPVYQALAAKHGFQFIS